MAPKVGYIPSDETRRKMSEWQIGRRLPNETRAKMSKWQVGKKHSDETKQRIREAHLGMKYSDETKKKMGDAHRGEKCTFWKGGLTSIKMKVYKGNQYRTWRKKVFERDNYTCRVCEQYGGSLHAHHIKPFSVYPKLRFRINNGITLCKKCHQLTNTYLKNIKKIEKMKQLELFNIDNGKE